MNLSEITPLVLAWNEEDNIQRCLASLAWARSILVIDSQSDDRTLDLCAQFPQVRVVQRRFDSFAAQANHGLSLIDTPWVLSLDADYIAPASWIDEVRRLSDENAVSGYFSRFTYCVFGQPLRGTLYPPRCVLYRVEAAQYQDDGHAHRVEIQGRTSILTAPLLHDDRKPLARWFRSQAIYAKQEAAKLSIQPLRELSRPDRIRKGVFYAPLAVLLWTSFGKLAIVDGPAGWYYIFQRVTAELMLSIALLDARLRRSISLDSDGPKA